MGLIKFMLNRALTTPHFVNSQKKNALKLQHNETENLYLNPEKPPFVKNRSYDYGNYYANKNLFRINCEEKVMF